MHLCAQCQNFNMSTDAKGYFIFSVPSEDVPTLATVTPPAYTKPALVRDASWGEIGSPLKYSASKNFTSYTKVT